MIQSVYLKKIKNSLKLVLSSLLTPKRTPTTILQIIPVKFLRIPKKLDFFSKILTNLSEFIKKLFSLNNENKFILSLDKNGKYYQWTDSKK